MIINGCALKNMAHKNWIKAQEAKIKSLIGQKIIKVIIEEMAFRGGEDGDLPIFKDQSLPFLQSGVVYLQFESGDHIKLITYQNDDTWGILLSSEFFQNEPEIDPGSNDSIYRTRVLNEFPHGEITSVNVSHDHYGNLDEIYIKISDKTILLVSGEVYETMEGKLEVMKNDESILLFLNHQDLGRINFVNKNRQ